MAGPGLPACAGGGLSRALGLAIWRYRTSPRASPRTGREGEGWRCPGVTARPCSQRPVPGQAPNRRRSGRPVLPLLSGPGRHAQRCGWRAAARSAPVPAAISWPEPVCRSQPAGTGPPAGHRAPVSSAPANSARARSAPARSASARSAPVRSAPARFAPVSLAPPRSAPERSARASFAASRSARARTAPASTAPVRSAPLRPASVEVRASQVNRPEVALGTPAPGRGDGCLHVGPRRSFQGLAAGAGQRPVRA